MIYNFCAWCVQAGFGFWTKTLQEIESSECHQSFAQFSSFISLLFRAKSQMRRHGALFVIFAIFGTIPPKTPNLAIFTRFRFWNSTNQPIWNVNDDYKGCCPGPEEAFWTKAVTVTCLQQMLISHQHISRKNWTFWFCACCVCNICCTKFKIFSWGDSLNPKLSFEYFSTFLSLLVWSVRFIGLFWTLSLI